LLLDIIGETESERQLLRVRIRNVRDRIFVGWAPPTAPSPKGWWAVPTLRKLEGSAGWPRVEGESGTPEFAILELRQNREAISSDDLL
jgi:hypothetical protein